MNRAHRLSMAAALILIIFLAPTLTSLTSPDPERTVLPAKRTHAPTLEHPAALTAPPPTGTASIRLLGINDLHGNLEPPADGDTGGAAYLAAHLDRYERAYPGGAIRVHAGDIVGGSPLISGHFHDEPTIYAMNEMRFDVGTVGNHEFDEGGEEMLRLINGGHREDGKQFKKGEDTSDPDFPGANFPYISANALNKDTGETVLPPYKIVERDGVRVGFIGVTTEETPGIVMPEAIKPYRFPDISESVDRYARELQEQGVESIVVLAHAGGDQLGPTEAVGEIISETAEMTDAVDVVIAGHTHNTLNVRVGGKLIVEAYKYGMAFSAVDLKVDRATGDVTDATAEIVPTSNTDTRPDPEMAALVEKYREKIAPLSERVVGTAAERVSLAATAAGESALGDFIADAERESAGTDFAFAVSGGIRGELGAGPVTYGELFAIKPFGQRLVKMKMTGDGVRRALEKQYREGRDRTLQVSGLRFVHDPEAPFGERVTSVTLPDGTPLAPDKSYTVAVEGFLAGGGSGFTEFREGRKREVVGEDLESLVRYVEDLPEPFVAPKPDEEQRMSLGG